MFKFLVVLLIVAIVSINAFAPSRFAIKRSTSLSMADIVDTAIATPGFSTLVAAVKAAGLVETLKGKGPFTVFAPTDAAFAKLPAGTVEGLLKDIPTLKNILTYHVVSGVQKPTRNGRTYTTVNGKEINVKVTVDTTESFIWGGQTNPAKVTNLGIAVDNGSIVVIDEVLLPYPGDEPPVHN